MSTGLEALQCLAINDDIQVVLCIHIFNVYQSVTFQWKLLTFNNFIFSVLKLVWCLDSPRCTLKKQHFKKLFIYSRITNKNMQKHFRRSPISINRIKLMFNILEALKCLTINDVLQLACIYF